MTPTLLDRVASLDPVSAYELDALLASEGAESLGAARPYFDGSLTDFVAIVNRRYQWYTHARVLRDALERVVTGEITRLMVFMPPRHGKSELVSRIFPAYYLTQHPDRWIGLTSYEATLAQDFSRTARDAYRLAGGEIRGDSKAVNLWQTPHRGGMWAGGVGGPLTGKGGHLLLIDDPIKNAEEAASETIRAKQKSWYQSTFYTRAEPDAAIVIVQTRWNEDDLSGWLLGEMELEQPERWHVISFDALFEDVPVRIPATCTIEDDWRAEGEALCPERYSRDRLLNIQRSVGSYNWSALYQQRPTPTEGGAFKRAWWKFYDYPENPDVAAVWFSGFSFLCQSWDCSFKDTDGTDYVVGQVWGVRGPDAYLLDMVRDRMDFPATVDAVRHLSAKWPMAHAKYVEEKANGAAVIQSLRKQLPGVIAIDPRGGKESRAAAVAPLVEGGNVYLPNNTGWVGDFINECAAFPHGSHDDMVDAASQALLRMSALMRQPAPEPEPVKNNVSPYRVVPGRGLVKLNPDGTMPPETTVRPGRMTIPRGVYRVPRGER